uniref:Uncharacterized protein n=1 Tax=Nelumbo nucifera TaxID=4432 RepID=A0A822ZKJ7_NELNU|nr:TPA_asm: hypothetical protein HUJ06_002119 [Nelumbo nucifera]
MSKPENPSIRSTYLNEGEKIKTRETKMGHRSTSTVLH